MRIVIAGPPKTGNVWLKCILGTAYDLRPLGPKAVPERPRLELFREWIGQGGFPDGTIFHQHYEYSDELTDAFAAIPAHIVTIVRDPYDVFVSSYFTLQQHVDGRRGGKRDVLKGKPLDHPDVVAFLRRGGFRKNMVKANDWMRSGRASVVRYEDLHRDPVETLRRLGEGMAPLSLEKIERAVETCSAENMRKRGGSESKHVRAAKVGDSRQRLNDEHLAVFREHHAELIQALGYEVR